MRRAQAVEHRRRVEAAVVAELARDCLEGLGEGLEEKLVAAGDGHGVLAEVAIFGVERGEEEEGGEREGEGGGWGWGRGK